MRHLILAFLLAASAAQAADRTTRQSLALPGGPLPFTAAVESHKLADGAGKPLVEIVTTAFLADGPNRPITFAFNGGPGAASAWLDLGAIGPWRVPLAIPVIPSQDPTPVDNAESWLPFTDLVFIDPPGTGYSRWLGDGPDAGKPYLNVDGDIRTLATTIRRWLEDHGRLAAPVILAGESYGGFRAPRLARALLEQQGVGVGAIVMISPVLDFNGRDSAYDPIHLATQLPSIAAAHAHAPARDPAAESYAAGEYITDLLRGPNDAAAQARIAARVAALTGLDESLLRRRAGRLDWQTILRDPAARTVASPYDITLTAADPFPAAPNDNSPDPALDGLRAPLTSAMLTLYRTRLDWRPDGAPARQYQLLNGALAREWDYGRSGNRPESMTALRQYLALDPTARALVVHGLYDIVTPYFASALLLAQVPDSAAGPRQDENRPRQDETRLALKAYPGGHMFYTDPASRRALQQDAQALIAAVLQSRPAIAAPAPQPPPPTPAPAPGTPTPAPTR